MNSRLQLCCILLASAGLLHAEVPRKQARSKYSSLWTNSPFTVKPVAGPAEVYNSLQDYVLLGVSPIEQGYRVTMMDRKKPNEGRVIIESHRSNDKGIKIKEVIRKAGAPLGTLVRIARATGPDAVIGFDAKFLTLAPPPAPPPPKTPPGGPPRPAEAQPGDTTNGTPPRAPRRRIVLATDSNSQNGSTSQGDTSTRQPPSGFQNRTQ